MDSKRKNQRVKRTKGLPVGARNNINLDMDSINVANVLVLSTNSHLYHLGTASASVLHLGQADVTWRTLSVTPGPGSGSTSLIMIELGKFEENLQSKRPLSTASAPTQLYKLPIINVNVQSFDPNN